MKTWQAILANIALVFAAAYVPQIKDPALQKAAGAAIVVVGGAVAKVNSATDENGNPLPKP